MRVHRVGPDGLRQLHQHGLGLPDAHNQIGAASLEVPPQVGDGLDEEGGAVWAGLVEAGGGLAIVGGVETVDGEDGEGFVVGGGETLVIEDAEVVAEPDDGGSAKRGGVGGVAGAVGAEGERGVEGGGGEGGFEGGLGRSGGSG